MLNFGYERRIRKNQDHEEILQVLLISNTVDYNGNELTGYYSYVLLTITLEHELQQQN